MMSHSLSLGGAERVAFDRKIIRKLGKWCQSVQNEDVERADGEQRDVEHMLRHCKLTDEAKQYYEIIRFKHDMIKKRSTPEHAFERKTTKRRNGRDE